MPPQPPCAILSVPIAIPHLTSTIRESTFNYYGPVQSLLAFEASKYLATVTDAAEPEVASTINSFILATQTDCIGSDDEKDSCWLTIRVTKPSKEFETPRWHQDGRMFPYDAGREDVVHSKYALTLLGPRTLMLQPDADILSTVQRGEAKHFWWLQEHDRELTEDEAHTALRNWLAVEFKYETRVKVGHGEVVRFSWGREDSPVHSEPDLMVDRVFVTVLYGSESELRGMCDWRNVEYEKFIY
ncbi:hypothetical protein BU23DRAFT_553466 [Bimuria novae-zelandiae CBS 107.79]|uniref:Uncharacterized protein n=1 Tax=Bimuria novae-zelandiae CBS 107.79 TaxID=1447943 RepID=A0A6A5VB77_9PLEO|nr:hypothetical protein BU23DRAFT_553466 [Bimuria novae-zelandiae CBS 107.79]